MTGTEGLLVEKRLTFLPFAPVRLVRRLIPHAFSRIRVVIGFRLVGRVVSSVPQVGWKHLQSLGHRRHFALAMILGADARSVATGNQGRSGHRADRGIGERMLVKNAVFRQGRDIWRRRSMLVEELEKIEQAGGGSAAVDEIRLWLEGQALA